MISLTELENEFKSAATKAGIEVHQLLLALAHFSQTAVPVLTTAADIAETATGNAELVPITNAVSATVQATGATILSQSSTVSQLGTVATVVEQAAGDSKDIELTNNATKLVTSLYNGTGSK